MTRSRDSALQLPGGFLTQRDKNAAKLTKKYLIDDGTHAWRAQTIARQA